MNVPKLIKTPIGSPTLYHGELYYDVYPEQHTIQNEFFDRLYEIWTPYRHSDAFILRDVIDERLVQVQFMLEHYQQQLQQMQIVRDIEFQSPVRRMIQDFNHEQVPLAIQTCQQEILRLQQYKSESVDDDETVYYVYRRWYKNWLSIRGDQIMYIIKNVCDQHMWYIVIRKNVFMEKPGLLMCEPIWKVSDHNEQEKKRQELG
jgi:hypothetical protein